MFAIAGADLQSVPQTRHGLQNRAGGLRFASDIIVLHKKT
jgi:hypothetical protein